jgi:succinate-semialdehyde dehydrogenase/glutarate-semialdehyde dehydrogenase
MASPLLDAPGGFIGGKWVRRAKRSFTVRNPGTGEVLATLPRLGAVETARAIRAAQAALEGPPLSLRERAAWLRTIVRLLAKNREELARIITLEQGKPLAEARTEVDYSAGFFRYFADHLNVLQPRLLPDPASGCRWTVHQRPSGIAALITPWNFPLAMLAKKLAAAFGAGCPAIVKPAEATPLSSIALWKLMEGAGLPKGRAALLFGDPEAIGGALCRSDAVRLLSFTGSTVVGRSLYAASAGTLKRLALELGGNAPFIVFEDADIAAAVAALVANKFRCAGQTCVCANRVYVHRRIRARFVAALVAKVEALPVGNGLDPGTMVGPLINREGFLKVAAHVGDALRLGARRVAGTPPREPRHGWGFFFPPTILTGATERMRVFREETFGPVIAIADFDSEPDVVAAANGTPFGLAAYVFTRDPRRAERVARALAFGHVAVNSGAGPTPEAPFGGRKQSGFGREGGIEGLLEFTEPQAVASAVPSARRGR